MAKASSGEHAPGPDEARTAPGPLQRGRASGGETSQPVGAARPGTATPKPGGTAPPSSATPEPGGTARTGSARPQYVQTARTGSARPESGGTAQVRPASPWRGQYRTMTVGMVAIVALSAFEQLAVATAMPTVAAKLGGLGLYATAFAAPLASGVVGMTVAGTWTDRRGPRAPLLAAIGLFVAGLLIAGLAPSMLVLVVGRIVQGLGSGGSLVALYVLVARVYPEALRARVFAGFSAAWVVPGIIGPALAGIVVEHIGWRWVFLAVPFLAIPALATLRPALASPETARGTDAAPVLASAAATEPVRATEPGSTTGHVGTGTGTEATDAGAASTGTAATGTAATGTAGTATATARRRARRNVLASVVAGIGVLLLHHGGQESGASMLPWLVVGIVALGATVPLLLPPGTLTVRRGMPAAVALRGLIGAAFFGTEIFLPLLLSTERGLSPSQAGVMLTASTVTWAIGSWVRGRTLEKPDSTLLLGGTASLVLGIAAAALLVWPAFPLAVGFIGWGFAGFGMGLCIPTVSLLVLRMSPVAEQGANSSSLQVVDGVATASMLALSGALFTALGGPGQPHAFLAGFAVTAVAALLAVATSVRTRS